MTLDLRANAIADRGAAALGAMLPTNGTLRTLRLDDNAIGDRGAAALMDGLQAHRHHRHDPPTLPEPRLNTPHPARARRLDCPRASGAAPSPPPRRGAPRRLDSLRARAHTHTHRRATPRGGGTTASTAPAAAAAAAHLLLGAGRDGAAVLRGVGRRGDRAEQRDARAARPPGASRAAFDTPAQRAAPSHSGHPVPTNVCVRGWLSRLDREANHVRERLRVACAHMLRPAARVARVDVASRTAVRAPPWAGARRARRRWWLLSSLWLRPASSGARGSRVCR